MMDNNLLLVIIFMAAYLAMNILRAFVFISDYFSGDFDNPSIFKSIREEFITDKILFMIVYFIPCMIISFILLCIFKVLLFKPDKDE